MRGQINLISLQGDPFILAKWCCLSSILFVEMLLSHRCHCVLILNWFIVNNKGGNKKRKWYFVTI